MIVRSPSGTVRATEDEVLVEYQRIDGSAASVAYDVVYRFPE